MTESRLREVRDRNDGYPTIGASARKSSTADCDLPVIEQIVEAA
jgi:hypothetical protein